MRNAAGTSSARPTQPPLDYSANHWRSLPELAAIDHNFDTYTTDAGAFRLWTGLQFIVDKLTGTIQYAQDGVVFFEL